MQGSVFLLSFAGIGVEIGGLSFEPEEEGCDFGVMADGCECVEFPFEGFFREGGVEEVVTAAAKPGQGLSDLLAVEVASDPAVIVSGLGDEVVGGQVGDLAVAEFASLGRVGQGIRAGVRGRGSRGVRIAPAMYPVRAGF